MDYGKPRFWVGKHPYLKSIEITNSDMQKKRPSPNGLVFLWEKSSTPAMVHGPLFSWRDGQKNKNHPLQGVVLNDDHPQMLKMELE